MGLRWIGVGARVEVSMLRVSKETELALEDIWIGLSMCNPDFT